MGGPPDHIGSRSRAGAGGAGVAGGRAGGSAGAPAPGATGGEGRARRAPASRPGPTLASDPEPWRARWSRGTTCPRMRSAPIRPTR
ncbi:hypothetical protein FGE12_20845 [Aggregicoccus sp. 17bor-14]|nr:hypothetical protein [Aggregicoccus sp. 17bor-14]